MTALWLAIKAFNLWRVAGDAWGAAWRWITASAAHVLAALLAVALLALCWQWHAAGVADRAAARRLVVWQRAFATEQRAYGVLAGALRAQNAAVASWAAAGQARTRAAALAGEAARKQGRQLETVARRIEREAPSSTTGPGCSTPPEVLAHAGDL
jgi:hypothetical protein